MIVVLKACRREIAGLPVEIRTDLADALARLDQGHRLSLPMSRPMPTIARGAHELRLKDRSGQYRVVYAIVRGRTVYVASAFKKATRAVSRRHIALARQRFREVLR